MLAELSIRDVLLIESLDLGFDPGLNVLTGETGAGKSILLDCLGFVLGWRGRADIVRQGAAQGEVTAVFEPAPGHPVWTVIEEAGLPRDDQLILRRINARDGRKRGFVNDRRVSGEVLRALSGALVELHGQHDDKGLLDIRAHRGLLDAFGAFDTGRAAVRDAWRALAAARKARQAAQQTLEEAARDADFLRHAVAELDDLAPEPGEDAELDAQRRRMQMAEKISADVAQAAQAMGPDGAEARLSEAIRWLEVVASRVDDPALEAPLAALSRALTELGEAQTAIEAHMADMEFSPFELERTEERLFAIRGLARKHNVQPDDLADLADDLRARLAAIDGGDQQVAQLEAAEAQAQATYDKAAGALTDARRAAAERLDAAMAQELAPLKMERAVFSTRITEADPGPEGRDQVGFTVATNPGAPPGPLARIASGGELSRFLLALKVCLSARSDGLTMIFDEIDRGVGGATADAVGRRLARVADTAQVLVVTHSPQVAAKGARHFQVVKQMTGETTTTLVGALDADARVGELARMLAGDVVTDEARAAARALLGS